MTTNIQINYDDSRLSLNQKFAAWDALPVGAAQDGKVISVATSEEIITISADITGGNGPGVSFWWNLDPTNYVEIGIVTTSYYSRLDANHNNVVTLAAGLTQIFVKANTAAINLWYLILER